MYFFFYIYFYLIRKCRKTLSLAITQTGSFNGPGHIAWHASGHIAQSGSGPIARFGSGPIAGSGSGSAGTGTRDNP